jgi:5-methylcytosine-specific restriction endonuclease McrA
MAETDWPDWNVYVRDGCKCVYCGFDGTKLLSWFQLEIDHLIPVRSQGADWPENKVVTCVMCNKLKHGYDPGNGRIQSPSDPMNRQELIE